VKFKESGHCLLAASQLHQSHLLSRCGNIMLPEMRCLRELIVVKFNESGHCFLAAGKLHQSHLPVFWEKLECLKYKRVTSQGVS
jgi:hypothetical protein